MEIQASGKDTSPYSAAGYAPIARITDGQGRESKMIGVQGVGGVQEPNGPKPASGRPKQAEEPKAPVSDGASFSSAAESAAVAESIIQKSAETSETREAKVEQARRNLEEGTYKVQDVVRQVASRLTKFIS